MAFAAIPDDYVVTSPSIDNSTWGNVEELPTQHYHLDWTIDWNATILTGSVVHDLTALKNVGYLQLDIWDLEIQNVYQVDTGAAYDLGQRTINIKDLHTLPVQAWKIFNPVTVDHMGQALVIQL
jgi:aminopeptidase N